MSTSPLKLPPLKQWINGVWLGSEGISRPVHNPGNQVFIAEVPQCTHDQIEAAIDAAHQAFPLWSTTPPSQRAYILKQWHAKILQNLDDLIVLLSTEQGKPYAEAKAELMSAAAAVEWSAEEARRIQGSIVAHTQSDKRLMVLRQPIGVAGAITPWNFPAGMVTRKVAPALAAGCTVILKPASQTPLTALALGKLLEEAGLPKGVMNILIGSAEKIGHAFATDSRIQKISFTGSTAVGQRLNELAAPHLKRLSLELGGNAPFIMFEDADIDAAIEGVMASKFRNAGQTCICANRLYVHKSHYATVVERIVERVKALRIGIGSAPETQIGPLIDTTAVTRALEWVNEAVSEGAKLHVGGKRHALGENFMEPTVLTDVTHNMRVVKEELFAPVLPILSFENDDEVIQYANATPYGLAAYFYSKNFTKIMRIAERLQSGMIGINAPYPANESVPFGGVKHSGLGREGGHYGLEEYTELKTLCLGDV
ncbi:MAG: NAD-dependent succinate-semialdehyde dehydrogenase [Pseudomonadota bacterium]